MRLDELKWVTLEGGCAHADANDNLRVFRNSSGSYCIWSYMAEHFADDWDDLDPITAQAVLFYLLGDRA